MRIEDQFPLFPNYDELDFNKKIMNMKEFYDLVHGPYITESGLFVYQELARRMVAPFTPYKRIILNMEPGAGKTRVALSIAKNFASIPGQKPILVLYQSKKNEQAFNNDYNVIFGDIGVKGGTDKGKRISTTKILKKGKMEYMSYAVLANIIIGLEAKYGGGKLTRGERIPLTDEQIIKEFGNRVIIYDEMHNLKVSSEDEEHKKTYNAITRFSSVLEGTGNIHVGLTATIMVNTPEELAPVMKIIFPDTKLKSKEITDYYNLLTGTKKEVKKILIKNHIDETIKNKEKVLKIVEDIGKKKEIIEKIKYVTGYTDGEDDEESMRKFLEAAYDTRYLITKNQDVINLIEDAMKYQDIGIERIYDAISENKDEIMFQEKLEEMYELEGKLRKIMNRGLKKYIEPKVRGKIIKVSKYKTTVREIKKGNVYNVGGLDLQLYPVFLERYQKYNYIRTAQRKTDGFQREVQSALTFSYPFIITFKTSVEFSIDLSLYTEEGINDLKNERYGVLAVRKAKFADMVEKRDGEIYLTNAAKDFFKEDENLKQCSTMFYSILNIIKKAEKKGEQVYIKLDIIEDIELLASLMKYKLDYQHYKGIKKGALGTINPVQEKIYKEYLEIEERGTIEEKKKMEMVLSNFDFPASRFALITGKGKSASEDNNIISSFNMRENIRGEFLRVIVGSPASGESINFPYARRFIHVPEWNPAKDIQVRGRVFRADSQLLFPENERYVKNYNIVPVTDKFKENTEYATSYVVKYAISAQKFLDIQILEQILEKTSVMNTLNKMIEKKIYKKNSELNVSSYLTNYRNNLLSGTIDVIRQELMINSKFTVDELLRKYKNLTEPIVRIALVEIEDKYIFHNIYGGSCIVRLFGDLCFLESQFVEYNDLDSYYSDKLYLEHETSEIALIVENNKEFAREFLRSMELSADEEKTEEEKKEEFLHKFLNLDIGQKIAVFEYSFEPSTPPKVKKYLHYITRNAWFVFEDNDVIIHLLAKSININYKGNSTKTKLEDQRMRALNIKDGSSWFDVDRVSSSQYISEINSILNKKLEKYKKMGVYGIMSISDGKFRICDTSKETKTRKDGETDKRTQPRGFICSEDNFNFMLPYLIEFDLKPPFDLSNDSKISYYLDIFPNPEEVNSDLISSWSAEPNKKAACRHLFDYLYRQNRIFFK